MFITLRDGWAGSLLITMSLVISAESQNASKGHHQDELLTTTGTFRFDNDSGNRRKVDKSGAVHGKGGDDYY